VGSKQLHANNRRQCNHCCGSAQSVVTAAVVNQGLFGTLSWPFQNRTARRAAGKRPRVPFAISPRAARGRGELLAERAGRGESRRRTQQFWRLQRHRLCVRRTGGGIEPVLAHETGDCAVVALLGGPDIDEAADDQTRNFVARSGVAIANKAAAGEVASSRRAAISAAFAMAAAGRFVCHG
jgi:hypothetical protein